jgi:hypothetical protein
MGMLLSRRSSLWSPVLEPPWDVPFPQAISVAHHMFSPFRPPSTLAREGDNIVDDLFSAFLLRPPARGRPRGLIYRGPRQATASQADFTPAWAAVTRSTCVDSYRGSRKAIASLSNSFPVWVAIIRSIITVPLLRFL